MYLILGGKSQGKLDYIENSLKIPSHEISNCEINLDTSSLDDIFSKKAVYGLEFLVKRLLELDIDPMEFILEKMKKADKSIVISCCEVGCGIVPLEKDMRVWREAVGRICCVIAKRATSVVRVYAGIATKIK